MKNWSRVFNQFTIAYELDMINAISAADIAFIMSSSTSAWLLSPLECSPQKQNGWTLRFCFWGWIMWKMYNKTIIEFGFRMIFSNYWMRLSRIWRILQIKEGVIHRGRRPRWITPSEICRFLHILRKPNSIIALLFIQNISSFLKEFRHYPLCFSAHEI